MEAILLLTDSQRDNYWCRDDDGHTNGRLHREAEKSLEGCLEWWSGVRGTWLREQGQWSRAQRQETELGTGSRRASCLFRENTTPEVQFKPRKEIKLSIRFTQPWKPRSKLIPVIFQTEFTKKGAGWERERQRQQNGQILRKKENRNESGKWREEGKRGRKNWKYFCTWGRKYTACLLQRFWGMGMYYSLHVFTCYMMNARTEGRFKEWRLKHVGIFNPPFLY